MCGYFAEMMVSNGLTGSIFRMLVEFAFDEISAQVNVLRL